MKLIICLGPGQEIVVLQSDTHGGIQSLQSVRLRLTLRFWEAGQEFRRHGLAGDDHVINLPHVIG
jgi:hypothetical protein